MLTDLQKKKLTYYFSLYDYDQDGFITQSDFQVIAHNIAVSQGWKPGWQVYDAVETIMMSIWRHVKGFIASDASKGACLADWLAHEEYMLVSEERYREYAVQMTEGLFDIMDVDADGIVDGEDYRQFYQNFRIRGELADECFRSLDTDQDGHLSIENIHQLVYEFHYSDDPQSPGNWLFGMID